MSLLFILGSLSTNEFCSAHCGSSFLIGLAPFSQAGETTCCHLLPDASFACGLRDEEESRCSAGDGFHVVFVVAAVVGDQQVVEDAHEAHEEQEAEDALSKQVAGSAANQIRERRERGKMLESTQTRHSAGPVVLVLPL